MKEAFTCPDCGMTSYHPEDVRFRYCGNCQGFKGDPDWIEIAGRSLEDQRTMIRLSIERPRRGKGETTE